LNVFSASRSVNRYLQNGDSCILIVAEIHRYTERRLPSYSLLVLSRETIKVAKNFTGIIEST
jgi:hypothetical protein